MIAEILIQNSDKFLIDLNARDNIGATAFEKACQQGKKDMVEMIIDKRKEGVLVNKGNSFSINIDLTAVHLKNIANDIFAKTVFSRQTTTTPGTLFIIKKYCSRNKICATIPMIRLLDRT